MCARVSPDLSPISLQCAVPDDGRGVDAGVGGCGAPKSDLVSSTIGNSATCSCNLLCWAATLLFSAANPLNLIPASSAAS